LRFVFVSYKKETTLQATHQNNRRKKRQTRATRATESPMKLMKLINATQHDQTSSPWSDLGVSFHDPAFCPYTAFSPQQPTRAQVVSAWRSLLARFDRVLALGERVDGFLLGGYAPAVIGLYQFLSQFRQTSFVAVMGPAPIVDGQRRGFVLQGLRQIPTPRSLRAEVVREGAILPPEQDDLDVPTTHSAFVLPTITPQQMKADRLIHVSARPLTDARRAEISTVSPYTLIASTPALHPPAGHDMGDFLEAIEDIARQAATEKCGILLDGPPAETLLHLYAQLGHQHPFFFAKTEVVEAGKPAQIVAVEKVPRF